jgi:HKD family nuclease
MKITLLSTSDQIKKKLKKYISESKELFCAVAWASENPLSDLLIQNAGKIQQLIIGTHFYQTDPKILASLLIIDPSCEKFKIISNTGNGVFHPKNYLFYKDDKAAAIIGSANFTNGALTCNSESVVCITGLREDEIFKDIKEYIETCWNEGETIDDVFIKSYERQYNATKKHRDALSSIRHTIIPRPNADHPELLSLTWNEFTQLVREDQYHSYDKRINILQESKRLFLNFNEFNNMPDADVRRAIAGILREGLPHLDDEPENILPWGWFGSMDGAGVFKNIIINNNINISLALDCIPFSGDITKREYDSYINYYKNAFEDRGRYGIGTASRLLAMKRPDLFVCVNGQNRNGLCADLGFRPSTLDFESYWTHIVIPITESTWWQHRRPAGNDGVLWDNRAAMLDSIYYIPR